MQPSDTSPCRSFVFPGKQNSPQLEQGEIDEIDEIDEINEINNKREYDACERYK